MTSRPLLLAALLLATAPLAGCGFTPLYAQGQSAAAMRAVDVQVNDARTGFLLRERLNDELARDPGLAPAYRLTLTVTEERDPRGLGPDNTASRYELQVSAAYALKDAASGRELTAGRQQVVIAYQASDPPYAGIVAQQDSQERAAAELARRIRLDLAKYFASTPRA